MKKLLLIFAIALCPGISSAQSSFNLTVNNISFNATNLVPLVYTYNNLQELLEPKVLNNAIKLDVCIRDKGCNVYAQVGYSSAPGPVPNNWMSQTLINDNSPNVQVVNNNTVLSQGCSLLFTQPSDGLNTAKNYSYYYDLNLSPVSHFVANGMYNFTIRYTMTLL